MGGDTRGEELPSWACVDIPAKLGKVDKKRGARAPIAYSRKRTGTPNATCLRIESSPAYDLLLPHS